MIASTPPVSGEGSLSRYLLTPTTTWSPRSIRAIRSAIAPTSAALRALAVIDDVPGGRLVSGDEELGADE
jgi:hypothetical protein